MAMDDYRSLSGPQKAALFMLALGDEHTTRLLEMMDDEELREISQSMATLGNVNSTMVEKVFMEFANQISSTGSLVGSYDSTERLLFASLPKDRAESIMEEIR
ncbi:MAG: flagellar motor switch protein FliG, partial [Magnetospiraceae bacterium]